MDRTRLASSCLALGLVAATDGNHGRAVAWTAGRLGQHAVIFMPADAAPVVIVRSLLSVTGPLIRTSSSLVVIVNKSSVAVLSLSPPPLNTIPPVITAVLPMSIAPSVVTVVTVTVVAIAITISVAIAITISVAITVATAVTVAVVREQDS